VDGFWTCKPSGQSSGQVPYLRLGKGVKSGKARTFDVNAEQQRKLADRKLLEKDGKLRQQIKDQRPRRPPLLAVPTDVELSRKSFGYRQLWDNLDQELNELVMRQWRVEETLLDNERVMSIGEQRAVERLQNTKQLIPLSDGRVRIQLGCLWRENEPRLENNYHYAKTRWQSLEQSKLNDPEEMKEYWCNIQIWIDRGYVEEVKPKEWRQLLAYYLAHFRVRKDTSSSTKIRPGMDGVTKCGIHPSA
jgi:hypothetical protein